MIPENQKSTLNPAPHRVLPWPPHLFVAAVFLAAGVVLVPIAPCMKNEHFNLPYSTIFIHDCRRCALWDWFHDHFRDPLPDGARSLFIENPSCPRCRGGNHLTLWETWSR